MSLCKNCSVCKISYDDILCINCIITNGQTLLDSYSTSLTLTDSPNDCFPESDSEDSDESSKQIKLNDGTKSQQQQSNTGFKYIARVQEMKNRDSVNPDIISKIKKALDLGQHNRTSEEEATHALNIAENLLRKFSISKKEIMEYDKQNKKLSGESCAEVTHVSGLDVKRHQWIFNLASSVCKSFNVRYYYSHDRRQSSKKISFNFYGILENTISSALAFEMAFNFCGRKAYDDFQLISGDGHVFTQRLSYLTGMSYRIWTTAKTETETECKETECKESDKTDETNKKQLTLYIDQCEKIADDYANENLNFTKSKDFFRKTFKDSKAYKQGYEDGEHVNLKRKTIE